MYYDTNRTRRARRTHRRHELGRRGLPLRPHPTRVGRRRVRAKDTYPNAIYAHLDRDLSGPVTSTSGRHPLPSVEAFVATLSRWGVDENVQVVAYDQSNGAYAARLWWLLRWVGHSRVAVLNGGFAAWQQAGLPVSQQPGVRQPRNFHPQGRLGGVVSTAELEKLQAAGGLATGERVLVDARAADRFAGQNETIDPVAGHVPGAINHPFARNLDARGRFLPARNTPLTVAGDLARSIVVEGHRDVRLRRHRLPQPARARERRTTGSAALCWLVE